MARVVKDRGMNGHDSILFRQDLDYPRAPGQITYYPPEPSDELRKQMNKDKAGGLIFYIIGFAVTLIGYLVISENYPPIDRYNLLVPLILVMGLVSAILYLVLNNAALAKLSRALPKLLMVALVLLLLLSVVQQITVLQSMRPPNEPPANASPAEWNNYNNSMDQFQANMGNAIDNIFNSIVNPGFFVMSAGLFICIAGGTMLWTSTKIVNQYIPAMIIMENPNARTAGPPTGTAFQAPPDAEAYVEGASDPEHQCQTCFRPMTYIEEYGRYYCYDCETYGPADTPE